MAEVVLGLASSHTPALAVPPEKWRRYGDKSRGSATWYRGQQYSWEELLDLRAPEHLENECTEEKFRYRYDACQKAIAHLSETLNRVTPDICVIVGDDQHEAFHDDNMPAISIYHGETVDDAPSGSTVRQLFDDKEVGRYPAGRITHPTDPVLGQYLIESMTEQEFDVARCNQLPKGTTEGSIGHAFYYVYRRLMNNEVTPNVPINVNIYPPNTPSASRCYKFGQALRQAIEAWDSNQRVAIIASGGLSHSSIEEDLDQRILHGLMIDDVNKLTDYSDVRFRSGTGETKNWIVLGGAMSGAALRPQIVDYVPCYRTEAGTGCAMGFAEWI